MPELSSVHAPAVWWAQYSAAGNPAGAGSDLLLRPVNGTSDNLNECSCGFHQLHLSFPLFPIRPLKQVVYLFVVSSAESLLPLLFPGGEKRDHNVFQGISH